MRLFGRICKITIYRPDGRPIDNPGGEVKDSGFKETLANGIEIVGGELDNQLRISFDIQRTSGSEPNTASVTLYNLSDATRGLLKQNPLTCVIAAGHAGIARHMFTGNIKFADSKMNGVTRETKLILADGGRALKHAQISKTYKAGTPVRTILNEMAAELGMVLPVNLAKNTALDQRIPRAAAMDGFVRDELTRTLQPYGLNFSVQNGCLQIVGDNETRTDSERVIGVLESGMVESPEYGTPDKKSGARTLTFKNLLYPELMPAARIRMNSDEIKGPHKLVKVKHQGDTRGKSWHTMCEARPL